MCRTWAEPAGAASLPSLGASGVRHPRVHIWQRLLQPSLPPALLQLCSALLCLASSPQAAPRFAAAGLAAISAEGRTSNLVGFPLLRADGEQAGNSRDNEAVLWG